MSSPSSSDGDTARRASSLRLVKKKRLQTSRACDRCRQKKSGLDSCDVAAPGAGTKLALSTDHIHRPLFQFDVMATRRPTQTKQELLSQSYNDELKARFERMQGLLSQIYPDVDFSQEEQVEALTQRIMPDGAQPPSAKDPSSSRAVLDDTRHLPRLDPPRAPTSDDDLSDESDGFEGVGERMRGTGRLKCRRFFGKSSDVNLVQSAFSLKTSLGTPSPSPPTDSQPPHCSVNPYRRPEFWRLRPWEVQRLQQQRAGYVFPEPDLVVALVETWFSYIALSFPFLHKASLLRSIHDGLHFRDESFGTLVLLLCATGARYSDDPRVLIEGTGGTNNIGHPHSSGWKYFNQVDLFSNRVISSPTLHDIQAMLLAGIFLLGSAPPQESWAIFGMGVRLAQDAGAHRQGRDDAPTVDGELWKRTFWCLMTFDIWTSSLVGRPCAISPEHYDVAMPIECDDEYWENPDPELAFKQPPGKPAKASFFVHCLKLNLLHSHTLRTIYSLNKSKEVIAQGKGWVRQVVMDLDSALNKWFDSTPKHLLWDPKREDPTFFFQSAALYSVYYYVQITIHRPFLPYRRKLSSLSTPSVAICMNAARTCSHIMDTVRLRVGSRASAQFHLPAFLSGISLLIRLSCSSEAGLSVDRAKDMQDLKKCIMLLEVSEMRWPVAGRYRDLLVDLSAFSNILFEQSDEHHRPSETLREKTGPGADQSSSASSIPAEIPAHGALSSKHDQAPVGAAGPGSPFNVDDELSAAHLLMQLGSGTDNLPSVPSYGDQRGGTSLSSINEAPAMVWENTFSGVPDVQVSTSAVGTLGGTRADNNPVDPQGTSQIQRGAPGAAVNSVLKATNPGPDLANLRSTLSSCEVVTDPMLMWSMMPSTIEFSEWDAYVANLMGVANGQTESSTGNPS
ncbi:fungal-specific transcription factor domain-containing protein [Gloeopeniophorella convolvens]|nr:fungal-specific transcription factor domain-containing protein [Gloeopeniophorella convolvens]